MLKELFFVLFLCSIANAESEMTEEALNISTSTISQEITSPETTMSSEQKVEAFVNKDLNGSVVPAPPAIVNFAKQANSLNIQSTSENGLVISKPINGCGGNCGGLSLTLVMILVCVISAVVGVILTALFVMRRRFSIWRLNGGKSGGCDLEGGVEALDAKNVDEKKEVLEDEKAKEVSSSCLNSVENKQAIVTVNVDNGHSNEAADLNKQELTGQSEENKPQASPSSSSPLIEQNDESSKLINDMQMINSAEQNQTEATTTTSSSSLIVNVLNELSESVASKLASKSPSVSKLAKSDPETQPFNNE